MEHRGSYEALYSKSRRLYIYYQVHIACAMFHYTRSIQVQVNVLFLSNISVFVHDYIGHLSRTFSPKFDLPQIVYI